MTAEQLRVVKCAPLELAVTQQISTLSRTGFVIFCVSCPIVWHFKLQTTISLSIEAGHVALPTATRGVICFVNLIQEIQDSGINLPHVSAPKMTCRVLHVPAICQWTSQTCPPTIPDAWLKVPSSSNNFRIPLFLSREER